MSRIHCTLAGLALAAFAVSASATAQQPAAGQPGRAATSPPVVAPPGTAPSPAGQPAAAQTYESRRVSPGQNGQGVTVKDALIMKLKKANQAEIELAQMAQQKVDDEELKQFTQMIIQDHQAFLQKLEQQHGQQGRQGQVNQPGQQPGQADAARAGRTQQGLGAAGQMQGQQVPQQLVQIMDQAHQNCLKMTKDMLQEHEGKDFEMAFLGHQIVTHTNMIAELKAIESAGPSELQPLVQQAIDSTQKHLDRAKQLAEQTVKEKKSS